MKLKIEQIINENSKTHKNADLLITDPTTLTKLQNLNMFKDMQRRKDLYDEPEAPQDNGGYINLGDEWRYDANGNRVSLTQYTYRPPTKTPTLSFDQLSPKDKSIYNWISFLIKYKGYLYSYNANDILNYLKHNCPDNKQPLNVYITRLIIKYHKMYPKLYAFFDRKNIFMYSARKLGLMTESGRYTSKDKEHDDEVGDIFIKNYGSIDFNVPLIGSLLIMANQ